jgi:CspA family cold shock protein
MAMGVVKFYKAEKGWGAITSAELPPSRDAFVHFSAIEGSGYRELTAGDLVDFDFEAAEQDSFRYRATRVLRVGPGPGPAPSRAR